jgi:hypothetical protein
VEKNGVSIQRIKTPRQGKEDVLERIVLGQVQNAKKELSRQMAVNVNHAMLFLKKHAFLKKAPYIPKGPI